MQPAVMQNVDPGDLDQIAESLERVQVTWATGLTALAVFAIGIVLARIARRAILKLGERTPGASRDAWKFAARIAFYLIFLFSIVSALGVLGFDVVPWVSALGVLAIVLAIGLQPLMENFAAGVTLQTRRPFESGDQIRVLDVDGTVLDITSRTVLIETVGGEHVHVPNRKVLDNVFTVYTAKEIRRSTLDVGLEYSTDLARAADLIRATAAGSRGVAPEPPVTVYIYEFDDSTINASIWFWHEPGLQNGWEVRHRVAVDVKRALDAAGITIAFPQRVLWWGERPTGNAEA
jgi:small-conductance mechanosensitive channel